MPFAVTKLLDAHGDSGAPVDTGAKVTVAADAGDALGADVEKETPLGAE